MLGLNISSGLWEGEKDELWRERKRERDREGGDRTYQHFYHQECFASTKIDTVVIESQPTCSIAEFIHCKAYGTYRLTIDCWLEDLEDVSGVLFDGISPAHLIRKLNMEIQTRNYFAHIVLIFWRSIFSSVWTTYLISISIVPIALVPPADEFGPCIIIILGMESINMPADATLSQRMNPQGQENCLPRYASGSGSMTSVRVRPCRPMVGNRSSQSLRRLSVSFSVFIVARRND
jgi:hypothetical protein